jgi:glutathione S-transferase
VLHDRARDRIVPETRIIIEYLPQHYPGPVRLLPDDPAACLEERSGDRFFDFYVSAPMQKIVTERIRLQDGTDPVGVPDARAPLDSASAMIDAQVAANSWATGNRFTIAHCSAAPGMSYASIVHPFEESLVHLNR